jgi:hypothetical protein
MAQFVRVVVDHYQNLSLETTKLHTANGECL